MRARITSPSMLSGFPRSRRMPHMKRRSIFIFALLLTSLSPAALPQAAQPQEKLLISYPGKTWAVEIDSPGFVVERNERQPDGRQYFLANDPATGLVLSAALEKGYRPRRQQDLPRLSTQPREISAGGPYRHRNPLLSNC